MRKKNNTIRISYYGIIGIVLLFGIIALKMMYVSNSKIVDGVDIKTFAANRNSTTTKLTASRGTIYSTNGEVLAKDVNSYTVIAYLSEKRTKNANNPQHVVDKEYTANVLSEYINMSPEAILKLLNTKGAYQVELGPGGRDISENKKLEIEALDLPGIDFMKSTKRYYPGGDFASYLIGYAKKYDNKIVGELGVEGYFNNELTGTDGYTTYQQDAYGYQIADTPVITEEAVSGKDIYLTIDSNVQMYMENAISELEKENQFEWVTITVANAKTGAILGSASTPSFDPNKLNITNYNNPLVSYSYEPGSTMKIYSFMAAMEEEKYEPEKTLLSGKMQLGKDKVTDWNDGKGWGTITYDKAFTYSSNVAAANLGLSVGKNKLIDYYKKFGFGSTTGVEIANELSGVINPRYEIEVANAAFGQGVMTTPIQNIQALTSLANKGTVIKPYIVDKVIDPDTGRVIYEGARNELDTPVSEETVNKMLELMYETVNGEDKVATGRVYKTNSTTLVGKTGTAQYTDSSGKYLYGNYNNIRSFAGLFPYEDPEYIIYMSVKRLVASSSAIAKPVKSIVESIAKYKNLDQLIVEKDETKLIKVSNYINKDISTAKEELKSLGLELVTIGNGDRVIDQYPTKGLTVTKGSKVFLRTNSLDIAIPNMKNWTSSEVGNYCNLAKIDYSTTGYGRVYTQSISPNTKIEEGVSLVLELKGYDEKSSDDDDEDKKPE